MMPWGNFFKIDSRINWFRDLLAVLKVRDPFLSTQNTAETPWDSCELITGWSDVYTDYNFTAVQRGKLCLGIISLNYWICFHFCHLVMSLLMEMNVWSGEIKTPTRGGGGRKIGLAHWSPSAGTQCVMSPWTEIKYVKTNRFYLFLFYLQS